MHLGVVNAVLLWVLSGLEVSEVSTADSGAAALGVSTSSASSSREQEQPPADSQDEPPQKVARGCV